MSYSGWSKALLLSVGLAACAHGGAQQSSSTTASEASAHVESGGKRVTDGPRVTRLHSAYLSTEARPQHSVTGGAVVAERENCSVWSDEGAPCDLSRLVRRSMTPGYDGW